MKKIIFSLWTILIAMSGPLAAQIPVSLLTSITKRIDVGTGGLKEETLFLHLDKTTYTNNETIWFAGYLTASSTAELSRHHTLEVALINKSLSKVVLSGQYVTVDGLSTGNMYLPDNVPPGDYELVAYTNIVDKNSEPAVTFRQALTIKTTVSQKLTFSINPVKSNSNMFLTYLVKASGMSDAKNRIPVYSIQYQTGSIKGQLQTDNGEASIKIPSGQKGEILSVQVQYKDQLQNIRLRLSGFGKQPASIKFYPEGGYLSEELSSAVGLETKLESGQPVALKGVLLMDGKPIDSVQTDLYGLGKFNIRPINGHRYSLKVITNNVLTDSIYTVPEVRADLPVINVRRAIVGDTLSFLIRSRSDKAFYAVVHNGESIFSTFSLKGTPIGQLVKVILKALPRGVAALTIFDSLANPVAERLFFAHYDATNKLEISTDKSVYKARQKVILTLRLQERKQVESKAIVSVSCAQSSRIEQSKFNDIENYHYVKNVLEDLPVNALSDSYKNRDLMETLLLVKGWRRFRFSTTEYRNVPDSTKFSLEFTGTVTVNGKGIKEPKVLTVLNDSAISAIATTDNGRFTLNKDQLVATGGKPLFLFVSGKNPDLFEIKVNNPFEKINSRLAVTNLSDSYQAGVNAVSSDDVILKDNPAVKYLDEVVIRATRENKLYNGRIMNKCGDFVCFMNYLNCPAHTYDMRNKLPVKGRFYHTSYLSPTGVRRQGRDVEYTGCTGEEKRYFSISGREVGREYYLSDFNSNEFPLPEYQSTLFWKPLVELSTTNPVVLSFYTSDLTAPYTLNVQGIGTSGLVSSVMEIQVK